MLNAATIAAIVAAVWAHPSGVAYLEKIEQLAQCQKPNPCCVAKPHGGGGGARDDKRTLTIADVNARYELEALRKRNQELDRAAAEALAKGLEAGALPAAAAAAAGDAKRQSDAASAQSTDGSQGAAITVADIDPAVLAAIYDEFF
jgi:hypothetical protein